MRPDRERVVARKPVLRDLPPVDEGHPRVGGDLPRHALGDPDEVDAEEDDDEGLVFEPRGESAETALPRQPKVVPPTEP